MNVLDELERLDKEATPGMWEVVMNDAGWEIIPPSSLPLPEPGPDAAVTAYRDIDAALVAKMRNALPSLLAAARALDPLRTACWAADVEGDLTPRVPGEMLCAADAALAPLLKEVGK